MPDNADGVLANIRLAMDALHCGAMLLRRDGVIDYANPMLAAMAGRPANALNGIDVRSIYNAADAAAIQDMLDAFDEPRELEFHVPRPDGSQLPALFAGRPLDGPSPLPDHRLTTIFDLSRLREAENARDARYREMARLSDTVITQAIDLKHYSEQLEARVRERTQELHEANMESVTMLAVASEAKDEDTGAHVRRIQAYTQAIAGALGIRAAEAEHLGVAAILHDVGKIHVPDQILKKPGPLTDDERVVMEQHTIIGERIISRSAFFAEARRIARSHHENWDGSGYPDRLAGDAIPRSARIVHVADVFDALTSARVYKAAWSIEQTADHVRGAAGKAFDPEVVRVLLGLLDDGRLPTPTPTDAK